jgi:hypothetical protein
MKKIILPIVIAACALAAQFAPAAPPPDVKEILSKPLTDIPGKEGLMLLVSYPPAGADEIHRHNAHAFVYVLEGSVVMQLRDAKPVTSKLAKHSMRARMTFTSSAATRATANRRSLSCSW